MNPINALTATTPVGSATSDRGSRQQFQQQAKPGQTFTATVLESAGSNRFYLDILGDKILAQSDTVTLSPGVKLTLEVLSTKPLLELRIISKNPDIFFGKTLTLLGKNIDISGLFQSLIKPPSPAILDQLSPAPPEGFKDINSLQQMAPLEPEGDSAQLKQLLERLGLSLETLLTEGKETLAAQSLKAALLEITTVLKDCGDLADTTNKLFGTLELYQLHKLRLVSENLSLYRLPLPFSDNGYLLVEIEDETNFEEKYSATLRFSLHLTLEPLGDIEINFLQTPDGLYIRFGCESLVKKEFINSDQETLKEMISSTEILGLSFTDTAGNPASDLIQQLIPDGKSMLDTKI